VFANILEKLFGRGNSYWLTRFVILRPLGFVYAVAFFVAAAATRSVDRRAWIDTSESFSRCRAIANRFAHCRHNASVLLVASQGKIDITKFGAIECVGERDAQLVGASLLNHC
jgi:hypothetical protein